MHSEYEGIVIKSINYRESDKILHIFTREAGKLTCIARGVRRIKKTSGVNVELFSHSRYTLYKGKGFYQINQTERIADYFGLRESIERLACASFMIEIVDAGLPEEEENIKLFELLLKTLRVLLKVEAEPEYRKLMLSFELKYISFLGYRPELRRCINCGSESVASLNRLSNIQGGVLCEACRGIDKYSEHLDFESLKALNQLLYSRLDDLGDLAFSENQVLKLQNLVFNYISSHIEKKHFKSLELLKTLNLF